MTDAASWLQPQGSVTVRLEDDTPVLLLEGEIDSAAVAAYETAFPAGAPSLPPLPPSRQAWVVDTSAVTFMNSSGVAFLVRCVEGMRAHGGRPVLRKPSRATTKVLTLTGVSTLFEMTDE